MIRWLQSWLLEDGWGQSAKVGWKERPAAAATHQLALLDDDLSPVQLLARIKPGGLLI
jgi:hypothetical protein